MFKFSVFDLWWGFSLRVLPVWGTLLCWGSGSYFLPHLMEALNFYHFKNFLMHPLFILFFVCFFFFSPCFFGCFHLDNYGSHGSTFNSVPELSELSLFSFFLHTPLFHLLPPFYLHLIGSFSFSVILLLVPSRVFLISVIALIITALLFLISLDT